MAQMRDEKGRFCKATTNNNTTLNKEKENKTMMNAREERTMKLQEAGYDVSNFFNLNLQIPMGAEVMIRVNGQEMTIGNPTTENIAVPYSTRCVSEAVKETITDLSDDPIAQSILEQGYVNNHRLFRRWILAHTIRMLNYQSYRNPNRKGWEACMKDCYRYDYQFTMLIDEMKVISILQKEDSAAFEERTYFFNGRVVVATLHDYLYRLKKYIKNARRKKTRCHDGKEYVKLAKYGNVYISDLDEKVYKVIQKHIDNVKHFSDTNNYRGLYESLVKFMNEAYNKLPYETTKCSVWKDAFKAAGAFYSMQNAIRFTGMILDGCTNEYDSEEKLYALLEKYKGEEWRLHKIMVDAIEYNNYDLRARIQKYKKEN